MRESRPFVGAKREWARKALICAALLLLATIQASAADARRVLLLHAFGHPYSPWSDMAGSFRAELVKKSPEPIDLYEVSLDTARVQDPQDEGPFVEYIRALLAGRKLDLIVPVGAPAAFFMERHRGELFPAAPMMIVGADLRRPVGECDGHACGCPWCGKVLPTAIIGWIDPLSWITESRHTLATSRGPIAAAPNHLRTDQGTIKRPEG